MTSRETCTNSPWASTSSTGILAFMLKDSSFWTTLDLKPKPAMMLGDIYAINMAYPKKLRYYEYYYYDYYEFIQKVLLQRDAQRLSPKVLGLKNKMDAGL